MAVYANFNDQSTFNGNPPQSGNESVRWWRVATVRAAGPAVGVGKEGLSSNSSYGETEKSIPPIVVSIWELPSWWRIQQAAFCGFVDRGEKMAVDLSGERRRILNATNR